MTGLGGLVWSGGRLLTPPPANVTSPAEQDAYRVVQIQQLPVPLGQGLGGRWSRCWRLVIAQPGRMLGDRNTTWGGEPQLTADTATYAEPVVVHDR